ncbi:Hsp20/alpha crystallin family protein [Fictibacillus iocasae]|uniref:Hsp20/alpha crystallin family protein n=1 Tax=Fictibacillus iocasae TaxID=2715437 RepID=A0ABW2NW73_9BACL
MDQWKDMLEWKKIADQYLGQSFFHPQNMMDRTKEGQSSSFAMNIYESPHELLCVAAMPGIEKDSDVTVTVENQMLKLSGHVTIKNGVFKPVVEEFSGGAFERELHLPCAVRKEQVSAFYLKGFLYIRLHKMKDQHRQPTRIDWKRFGE